MSFKNTITPYLIVDDGVAAIEFYKKAFGATEEYRVMMPDGKLGHVEIIVEGARFMMASEFPEYDCLSAKTIGNSPVIIHLQVENVDQFAEKAVAEGLKALTPIADQFYGHRNGKFQDPFGHIWDISTEIEKLTTEEIQERVKEGS